MCSNMRLVIENSCNLFYLESGLCKAGLLSRPMKYAKAENSTSTLVAVKILIKTTAPKSLGTKQKPGKLLL